MYRGIQGGRGVGVSSEYKHPLRDWIVRHGSTPHLLATAAGIAPRTVRRLLLGYGCHSSAVAALVNLSVRHDPSDPIHVDWLTDRPDLLELELDFSSTPWSDVWPMKKP
jgi:hypothetical protein